MNVRDGIWKVANRSSVMVRFMEIGRYMFSGIITRRSFGSTSRILWKDLNKSDSSNGTMVDDVDERVNN